MGLIITLLVIGGLLLVAGIVLLYIFVFSRNSVKRQVKDLERKFSYLDALLIGQDSQYIHRIEIVSRTNLLYVDKYSEFSRRFKEIYEIDDKFAESKIKQVKNMIAAKQFKNIKTVIEDVKNAVSSFEEKVNALDAALYEVIRPEEESRQTILKLKESYRSVKQTFYAVVDDIEIVSTSFNKAFDKLDESFATFETHIDSAEYDDANALIPVIADVVNALKSALEVMPNLCILVTKILVDEINELETKYNKMEEEGYPLFNVSFRSKVDDWNYTLSGLKKKLISLQVAGVSEECNRIQLEIDEVTASLNKEVSDKEFFIQNNANTYKETLSLEKVFLKICSFLPEVEKIYIIDDSQKEKIEELRQSIDRLGISKRSLDTFIHSSTPQPYSYLREKLEALMKENDINKGQLDAFKAYVEALKKSSEEAYSLVFAYYYRLRDVESALNNLMVEKVTNDYKDRIDECYALLDEIDKLIKVLPIDVSLVNEKVDTLKNKASILFDDIEKTNKEAVLAESAIVYANRDRNHQAEVNEKLNALEERFFEGDFENVYHEATEVYRSAHVDANE